MGKFFVNGRETGGPEDWRALLADPEHQWRDGYSAKALAYSWEEASGFPPEVKKVFSDCAYSTLRDPEMLLGYPEYKVSLPGGGRSSQSDIFILAKSRGQLIAITVEGKVKEPFDELVGEWMKGIPPQSGKPRRLRFLKQMLGIEEERNVDQVRYQLLHRTVSALIEAERVNAPSAVMLVHSFSQEDEHSEDYQAFLDLFGVNGTVNSVSYAGRRAGVNLYLAWVRGDATFLFEP